MLVHQAFRYELAPTAAQRASLTNHAGAARWAWNWGLSVRRKAFTRRRQTMNAMDLHRLLNRLKRTPRYGWLYEVSKCAPQEALRDLDRAYANAWRGRKSGRRIGLPRWKKRGRCPERFRLTGAIRVQDGAVVLPRIGRVATKESTGKFYGRILSATCRQQADRWYCSLTVQVDRPDPAPVEGPVVGVDRGITTFAVCSDGTGINNPRALECSLRKLRRRARAVSRKRPGSRHRRKAAVALAQCHHGAGESQVGDRGGGPARGRHAPQPAPGQGDQRPGLGGVPSPTGLQDAVVRQPAAGRAAVLPVVEDLLGLWAGHVGPAAQRTHLPLPGVSAGR